MYTVLYGTLVRSVKACIGSLYMLNKVCVSACMECCIWPERDMLLVVWSVVYGQKGTCDYLYGVLHMDVFVVVWSVVYGQKGTSTAS